MLGSQGVLTMNGLFSCLAACPQGTAGVSKQGVFSCELQLAYNLVHKLGVHPLQQQAHTWRALYGTFCEIYVCEMKTGQNTAQMAPFVHGHLCMWF